MALFPNLRLLGCAAAVAGLVMASALSAGPANDRVSDLKVYIDPETGEILETPPPEAEKPTSFEAGAKANQRATAPGLRSWVNEDGVQMITLDPSRGAELEAVLCDDESLRIGHGTHADDRKTRCAEAGQANE